MFLAPMFPLFQENVLPGSIISQTYNFHEGLDISDQVALTFQAHFTEFQPKYTRVDQIRDLRMAEEEIGANLIVLIEKVLSGMGYRLGIYPKFGA